MEEVQEIKQYQHHSKFAVYAVVGFLVVITFAVLIIAQRLQSEKAYLTSSQVSEYDSGQYYTAP